MAQVKCEMTPTGVSEVQRLYGISAAEQRLAAFFSLRGYTAKATEWADNVGMLLFRFDYEGSPEPVNRAAVDACENALPPDDDPWTDWHLVNALLRSPKYAKVLLDPEVVTVVEPHGDHPFPGQPWRTARLVAQTVSVAVAHASDVSVRLCDAREIGHAGDMFSVLSGLSDGEVLAVLSCDALGAAPSHILDQAVRDGMVDVAVGRGPGRTTIPLALPHFRLILGRSAFSKPDDPHPLDNLVDVRLRIGWLTDADRIQRDTTGRYLIKMMSATDEVEAGADRINDQEPLFGE